MKFHLKIYSLVFLCQVFQTSYCALPSKVHHVPVSNSEGLVLALANAKPDDMIILSDGIYEGPFTANVSGEPTKPIFLVSKGLQKGNLTIYGSADKPAFTVHGNYWRLMHLSFQGAVGLFVTGDNFWGNGLSVKNGDIGIILQGVQNIVMKSYVADSSKIGIDVYGKQAILARNAIVRSGIASIVVRETATIGYLKENMCDGKIENNGTRIVERNTVHLRQ